MISFALLVTVAMTLGLIVLLLRAIHQQQPKPISLKAYKATKSASTTQHTAPLSLLQKGTVGDRARLRTQAHRKRPGRKPSAAGKLLSQSIAPTPSPDRLDDARRIVEAYRAAQAERKATKEAIAPVSPPVPPESPLRESAIRHHQG